MQIILHIGQQKTASTAIQAYFAQNREQLAAQSMLYPRALGVKKAALIKDLVENRPSLGASREKILSNLKTEFLGTYTRALLSEENLFNADHLARSLRKTFEPYATSWRVLCYVRRPDEHIASLYQQSVKGPYIGTFDSFFDNHLQSDTYTYTDRIDRWAEVFGKEAIEVRVFHRKTLKGGPIEDFTQWVALDPKGLSSDAEGRVNESLDPVNTELLRVLHLCLVEQPDLFEKNDLKPNLKPMVSRLRALDTGERLRLDTARAKLIQEQFRKDHERLAERYLSPEHAAVLLSPPAETPPQPPIDRDALFNRIMTLFNDPDLARFAVERAEQPTSRDKLPAELLRPPREALVARTVEHFNQKPNEESGQRRENESALMLTGTGMRSSVKRAGRYITSTIARMLKFK